MVPPARDHIPSYGARPIWVALVCPTSLATALSACRIALHAARIGGGAAAAAVTRGGSEAALRPVRLDLDDMPTAAQLCDCVRGQPTLDEQHTRARLARPERRREMLGVPSRRIDGLLQVHAAMDVAHEELRDPLVLLIATGRAPGEIRLTIAQRHRGRERGARTLPRRQRRRMPLLQPKLLRARAEAEAERRDDR